MSLKQLSLLALAIAIVAGTTAAITSARRGPLLVPTLDLSGETVGGSVLLGSSTVNGIPLKQFSSSQVANGVTLVKDEHNVFTCPDGGPVITTNQQSDSTTLFWGYEYTGNEVQNKKDGKLGRSLFDGKFFISQGQLNAAPGRYDFLNDLTSLAQGKMYYFMSEADLTLTCAQGIAKAGGSSSSSSTSTSTSTSTSSSDSSDSSSSDSSDSSSSDSSDSSVSSSSSSAGGPGGNDGGSSDSSSSDSSDSSDSSWSDPPLYLCDGGYQPEPCDSSSSSSDSSDSSDSSSSSSFSGCTSDIDCDDGNQYSIDTCLNTGVCLHVVNSNSSSSVWECMCQDGSFCGGGPGCGCCSSSSSSLEPLLFTMTMNGTQVPTSSTVTGTGIFVLNMVTGELSYDISYGSFATSETVAHIHGPAAPGNDAGAIFTLSSSNPKTGSVTLFSSQIEELINGLYYVNIHTSEYPNGEIRGQILLEGSSSSSSSESSSSSYFPVCGNGILDDGEQCDDGNLIDGDGCFDTCKLMIPPSSL